MTVGPAVDRQLGREIASASGVLFLGTLLGMLLGIANTLEIAAYFGTSEEMDAFALARVIPDAAWVLIPLLVSRVYLPLFSRRREDRRTLSLFFSSALNLLGLLGLLLTLLALLGAPWIVSGLVGPGRPRVQHLATQFMQSFSATLFLACIYQAWVALAQADRSFLRPALAQAVGRLAMLLVVAFGAASLGIYALIAGTIASFVAALLAIARPRGRAADYLPATPIGPAWEASSRLLLPLAGLSALEQVHALGLRGIAAALPAGRIAALDYATGMVSLVQALLVAALLQAVFPFISDMIQEEKEARLAGTVGAWLQVATVLIVPVSLWLLLLREPVIRLLFARGAFSARSIELTSAAVSCYVLGTLPIALAGMLELVFLTRQRLRWCLALKALGVGTSLLLAWLLSRSADVQGIGAGIAIGYAAQGLAGLALACRLLPLDLRRLLLTLLRTGAVAGAGCLPLWLWPVPPAGMAPPGALWLLLLSRLAAAAAIYLAAGWLLDLPGLRPAVRWLARRLIMKTVP